MDTLFTLWIIPILIGFVVGLLIPIIFRKKKKESTVGDLVIDRSDEDGPLLFLELNEPLYSVESQEIVRLNVIHKNYISQK